MKQLFLALFSVCFFTLHSASSAAAQTRHECKLDSMSDVFASELQFRPEVDSSLVLERDPNSESEFSLKFTEESLALTPVLQIDEEDWRGAFRVTWLSEVSGQVYQITVNTKNGEGLIASHLETGDLQAEVVLSGCQLK